MPDSSGPAGEFDPLTSVRRHVRILVDIGRIAGETADVDRFLDQVAVQVSRAVGIRHVKILRYRPRTADLLVVAGVGWKEGVVGTSTLSSDFRSPPGRAFQTAEPVTIHNLEDQTEFIAADLLKEHGIVSLTNVPVLIDGAAWGVLEVDSAVPRDFSEDTSDFLSAAGALIGSFVQRTRSHSHESERIMAAAAEARNREVLLGEMQHRVRNNFQLVLASIAIQKRRYPSPEAQRALDHVASRINAISLAHDQLAPRNDGQIVKLSDYVRALSNSIRQQVDNVTIDVEADELVLTIDRAVPIGLILNELATNSIKHAFGPEGGRIHVKLTGGIGYGEGRLTVSDNGKGITKTGQGGSGLKLVTSLARQMGGTITQDSSSEGTTTSLLFPLIGA